MKGGHIPAMKRNEKIKAIGWMMCTVFFVVIGAVSLASAGTTADEKQSELFEKKELNHAPDAIAYAPAEILVTFKSNVRAKMIHTMNLEYGTSLKSTLPSGTTVLNVPADKTVEEMVKLYARLPEVEYAEPNYAVHAFMIPNDPYYSYQWHLDNDNYGGINLESAWDVSTGEGVVVAVIDSGVAYEDYGVYCQAPDLAGTTFVQGYDFVNGDTHPNDDNGHGTHVAGTIAQATNNDYGTAGVAFDCAIMPVKVLNETGNGYGSWAAEGIYYAVDNGADVISMSLGGPNPSRTLEDAVAYAYNHGVTVVAAAGNEYGEGNPAEYPAAYDDYVIAVGATRYDETRSYYSNTGRYLDLAAPGGDLRVDQNGDEYADGVLQETFGDNPCDFYFYFSQGTSMATPHVSGVAALLIANGVTGPDNVRNRLESTAEDKGASGWDEQYGWGIVDAYAALQAGENQPPYKPGNPSPPAGAANVSINADVSWTCGDPDGDVVIYDVYLEAGDSTPDELVSSDQTETTYDPGTLNYSSQYYWKIVATDMRGKSTTGAIWDFTTEQEVDITPPTVISHAPTGADVPVTTTITAAFSEVMNNASAEDAFSISPFVTGSFRWNGSTMIFTPGSNLVYETTYNVTIGSGAADLAGNTLESPYSWEFTTGTIGEWSEDIRLTTDSARSGCPAIAVDSYNNVHIAWNDDRDGNYEIYYTKVDNTGKTLVDDTRLTSDSAYSNLPTIAVDSYNNVHIAWCDKRDGAYEIYYTTLDNTGQTLVDDTRVTLDPAGSWWPTIAVDSYNNVHIAWCDKRDGNYEIYYTKLDNKGNTLVDDTRLTADSAGSNLPTIAVDSYNNVHITWCDERDGAYEIYYTRLDNKGNTLVDDTRVTTDPAYSRYPTIAVDSYNNAHITWHDKRDGNYEIYYTKLDTKGETLVDDTRVTTSPADSKRPTIAVDSYNNVHITWEYGIDGNSEIYYTKLDTKGKTLVDDTRLTTDPADSWNPTVAVDSNNNAHIAWQDKRDGNYEIYYKHTLGAQPDIWVSPTSFEKELSPDDVQSDKLTIGNNGTGALEIQIVEQQTGSAETTNAIEDTCSDRIGKAGNRTGIAFVNGEENCKLVSEVGWLSVAPRTGTVNPGSQTTVSVTYNTTGLPVGDYDANISIMSNDPDERVVAVPVHLTVRQEDAIFDTGQPENPYPSISGTHTGTITPSRTIKVSTLYTYPCPGTGGHTEYVRIYGNGVDESKTAGGYTGDYHNVTFDAPFTLEAGKTYSYEIRTGSYPQIIHAASTSVTGGTITCRTFVDANGEEYTDWIPAIRLELKM
jgi:serine protease